MKPYIICHMLSSIDGRIDASVLKTVTSDGEYEATGDELQGDAWICGRTTMQQHFANSEPFASKTDTKAGPQEIFVATHSDSYAISVDTFGKLNWSGNEIDGDHLICLVSEAAPAEYITMLREKSISFIVSGKDAVDLQHAMQVLAEAFGIHTLLLEGGGHINGAFMDLGLVDEISLLLVPGVDGREGVPALFDGSCLPNKTAVPLKLKSVEKRKNDALWIRYDVLHR